MPRIRLIKNPHDSETVHVHFPQTMMIGGKKRTSYPVACTIHTDLIPDVFGAAVDYALESGETFAEVEANPVFSDE